MASNDTPSILPEANQGPKSKDLDNIADFMDNILRNIKHQVGQTQKQESGPFKILYPAKGFNKVQDVPLITIYDEDKKVTSKNDNSNLPKIPDENKENNSENPNQAKSGLNKPISLTMGSKKDLNGAPKAQSSAASHPKSAKKTSSLSHSRSHLQSKLNVTNKRSSQMKNLSLSSFKKREFDRKLSLLNNVQNKNRSSGLNLSHPIVPKIITSVVSNNLKTETTGSRAKTAGSWLGNSGQRARNNANQNKSAWIGKESQPPKTGLENSKSFTPKSLQGSVNIKQLFSTNDNQFFRIHTEKDTEKLKQKFNWNLRPSSASTAVNKGHEGGKNRDQVKSASAAKPSCSNVSRRPDTAVLHRNTRPTNSDNKSMTVNAKQIEIVNRTQFYSTNVKDSTASPNFCRPATANYARKFNNTLTNFNRPATTNSARKFNNNNISCYNIKYNCCDSVQSQNTNAKISRSQSPTASKTGSMEVRNTAARTGFTSNKVYPKERPTNYSPNRGQGSLPNQSSNYWNNSQAKGSSKQGSFYQRPANFHHSFLQKPSGFPKQASFYQRSGSFLQKPSGFSKSSSFQSGSKRFNGSQVTGTFQGPRNNIRRPNDTGRKVEGLKAWVSPKNIPKPGGNLDGARKPGNSNANTQGGSNINKFPPRPQGDPPKPQGGQTKPQGDQTKPQGDQKKPQGGQAKPQGNQTKPQGGQTKPQGNQIKPLGSQIKPLGSQIKPQESQIKPQGGQIKPQGNQTKPQGRQVKPQGSQVKSQGNKTKKQGKFTWSYAKSEAGTKASGSRPSVEGDRKTGNAKTEAGTKSRSLTNFPSEGKSNEPEAKTEPGDPQAWPEAVNATNSESTTKADGAANNDPTNLSPPALNDAKLGSSEAKTVLLRQRAHDLQEKFKEFQQCTKDFQLQSSLLNARLLNNCLELSRETISSNKSQVKNSTAVVAAVPSIQTKLISSEPLKTFYHSHPFMIHASKISGNKLSQKSSNVMAKKTCNSLIYKKQLLTPNEIIQDYVNLVNRAKRERKTYTIVGNFFSVRRALAERGWVEKIRINVMEDREKWKKIGNMSNLELVEGIRDKENGDNCRRAFLSKLLAGHQVDFYWDYMTNPFNVLNDNVKRTLINRYPVGSSRSYATKAGLCESLKEAHWFYIEGYSNVLFPRTYDLSVDEEVSSFIEDFRITAAISLLKWVQMHSANAPEIISPTGTIPTSIFNFATMQCYNYIKKHEHKDIEEIIVSARDYEWDVFLEKFYLIAHQQQHFKVSDKITAELMLDQSNFIVSKLRKFVPNLNVDGTMNMWLMKPHNGSRGCGILVCRTLRYILDTHNTRSDCKYVIQKYVERPLLIHNTKFDIRQWFLITNTPNFTVWLYKDCYLRFCSQMYNLTKLHESIHLTNNSVQCKYKNCSQRSEALPPQNMWHSDTFQKYLTDIGQPTVWKNLIYKGIKESLVGLFMLCQDKILARVNSFELCGADYMVDEEYHPYLIEINSRPAMYPSTRVTAQMCPRVLEDVVKVVVDNLRNPNASTGSFELIYRDTFSYSVPKHVNTLCVNGISYFTKYACAKSLVHASSASANDNKAVKSPSLDTSSMIQKLLNLNPSKVRKDVRNTLEKILSVIHSDKWKKGEKDMSDDRNKQFKMMLSEFVDIISRTDHV